ncbi:uncharacterized protein V6R79_002200 [Siganus canaliculatus]
MATCADYRERECFRDLSGPQASKVVALQRGAHLLLLLQLPLHKCLSIQKKSLTVGGLQETLFSAFSSQSDSDGKKPFFTAELQLQSGIKQRDSSQNTLGAPDSNYLKCHTDVCSLLNPLPENVTFTWKQQVNSV